LVIRSLHVILLTHIGLSTTADGVYLFFLFKTCKQQESTIHEYYFVKLTF